MKNCTQDGAVFIRLRWLFFVRFFFKSHCFGNGKAAAAALHWMRNRQKWRGVGSSNTMAGMINMTSVYSAHVLLLPELSLTCHYSLVQSLFHTRVSSRKYHASHTHHIFPSWQVTTEAEQRLWQYIQISFNSLLWFMISECVLRQIRMQDHVYCLFIAAVSDTMVLWYDFRSATSATWTIGWWCASCSSFWCCSSFRWSTPWSGRAGGETRSWSRRVH